MEKRNIEKIANEIDSALSENNKRFPFPWKECHAECEPSKAYIFEEKEKGKLGSWKKAYKHLFPRNFHEDYDKKLIKLTEEAGRRQYLKIIDKKDPELERVCKDIARKYGIIITDNF